MAAINIDDETMLAWDNFWRKHDQVEYPNLKNFTIKKLREVMKQL